MADRDSVIRAFMNKQSSRLRGQNMATRARGTRYESTGDTFYLWGHQMATWSGSEIELCDTGRRTNLTKSVLDDLLLAAGAGCRIVSERRDWRLKCGPWDAGTNTRWLGCVRIKPGAVARFRAQQAKLQEKQAQQAVAAKAKRIRDQARARAEAKAQRARDARAAARVLPKQPTLFEGWWKRRA